MTPSVGVYGDKNTFYCFIPNLAPPNPPLFSPPI